MKKFSIILLLGMVLTLASGCTKQRQARTLGGTDVESLPVGRKLVSVAWKRDNLWILTKPMTTNDVAETYEFNESSSWGILEGKVIIQEKKN